ncbi:MAG TPA: Gfo/Idh/MocA family oxidoreductase [Thermomicrobiales bacterium]|nr:Gfo/Idh/MocA family oxidoreductase [Thermomicrobiales bacterium]
MAGQLGVGVIGVGTIGRRHAENLARRIPQARLVAVADVNPDAARAVAADFGAGRWFTTAEELAADRDVEAVIVASSHQGHLEGIEAAARHGKDVFCEKPIAPTLAEADAAIAAVAAAGVRLQIGFMRRYDRAYREAKRRIDAGEIGTPVLIKATHRNGSLSPSLRPTDAASVAAGPVGAFIDSAIHDYDNARWLLGDEVVEVQAYMASVLEPARPDDLAISTLRFARGGLGDVEVYSTCGYGYDVRTEIAGTTGTLFIGDLRDADCTIATAAGVTYAATDHWLHRFADAYLTELDDWATRTLAGEPPTVTGADGRAALAIAVAATRSAQDGGPVRLPVA